MFIVILSTWVTTTLPRDASAPVRAGTLIAIPVYCTAKTWKISFSALFFAIFFTARNMKTWRADHAGKMDIVLGEFIRSQPSLIECVHRFAKNPKFFFSKMNFLFCVDPQQLAIYTAF
ncbi:MAG: hypothetical protein WC819_01585 [Parcubacteria group bacterium]